MSDAAAERAIRRSLADGIRPAPALTVSQWADENRKLPKKSSAEPGPWRTERTPYLRELMDNFSSSSNVEEIVFMKGSQIGGTEALLNALGYAIDHSPGPIILVFPTVDLAKRGSRQRVSPLVTDSPRIAEKVGPAKGRDSKNATLSKEFPGGQLIITGANSAVGLRSMPAQYALMDEIDGWPVDVDEEGSPIALVEVRQRTFARRKRMKVSTPTIDGRSAIQSAFESTDQRRYFVPCPLCGEFQTLEFSRLVWTKLELPPAAAVYECSACNGYIRNHQKTAMLAAGEWRATRPDRIGKIRGYHLSALYSPVGWLSWGEIAVAFVKAEKDPDLLRVFINTILGEVWKSKGEAPEWAGLYNRRETYAIGTVPAGALVLTAGVDVQKDRLVYEVVGWGRGKRSWSIDAGELPGETADLDRGPWSQLDALLARTYPHAAGVEMPIRMLAIDSGYNTANVYSWAKRYPMSRVVAVKGQDHGGALVGSPTAVEITDRGRKLKRGGRVWPVSVNIAKSELYGWLRLELVPNEPEPAGYCHFPEYAEAWFRELTAEQMIARKSRKGFVRLEWEVIAGRQNHALDCRVYARAAAGLAGLDRMQESDWIARERMVGVSSSPAAPGGAPRPPAPARPTAGAPRSQDAPGAPPRRPAWLPPRPDWLKGR